MKKIFFLGIVFAFFTLAVSAQRSRPVIERHPVERGFRTGQLTRGEKFRLQQNQARYHHAQRRAFRDGRLTPFEKRKLHTMKRHDRRETFRHKHNNRRRVI
jgi:hypothetical protein